MSEFACSVVIPSYDRAAKLDLLLAALAGQDTTEQFEVIVVLDGSKDASREVLSTWEQVGVFASLRWIEQSRQGQAIARNTGALVASAPVLLFLDDDVIPDSDLISTHLGHHAGGERIVVLGDCEIVCTGSRSLAELAMWMWWEDTNHRRAAAWQPPSYRDFCTGNLSLRRDDFAGLGGFDQDFTGYGREDYELGYRLLQTGVRFVADRRARARHFNTASARGMCAAARQEAHGDVLIAQKHPELITGLRLMSCDDMRTKIAAGLAMYAPWLGATLCFFLRGVTRIREKLRLRRRWRSGVDLMWAYSYWRGLHDRLGSLRGVRALRAAAVAQPDQDIDLHRPLPEQVSRLNIDVPSSLSILYDRRPIGRLDLKPNLTEPMLPWLSRELCAHLSSEILAEVARA
ncbi:MAG TPA: glycosyltransferase, partial [Actinomycetota bacterium]|nr:glycosyltransferase [Actinomycetota bacterium]